MKVTVGWLKDLVDFDLSTERLVDLLDLSGTKVESVGNPGAAIDGVVVAEVIGIEAHPNADNLILVDVKLDEDRSQRVVCGVRNFAVGDRVPLATVGARLGEMSIAERKIRGQVSAGMLCSPMELGVSRDHSGILVLPQDAPLGQDIVTTLDLDDTILELEITLNRPDCMSILGVAREIAALTDGALKSPEVDLKTDPDLKSDVKVRVEDAGGCPRYLVRYVDQLEIAPSPLWLTSRITACGIRPVSNVVDVTNYVLLELGHPLHAFDADLVSGRTVVVRRARPNERLTTLDGVERELHPDDILIADSERAIGLAGVMGGGDSEVSESTTTVILESAYFDPASIAFTSRRHLLRTEASARFERGMDPEMVPLAAARAAQLMAEVAGGRVAETVEDAYPKPFERGRIRLRPARTDRILGIRISPDEQTARLTSIGLEVAGTRDALECRIPTWRPDLEREIDLIEEVARLHGLHELPATLPPGRAGRLTRAQSVDRALRRTLVNMGVSEVWTPSLISPRDLDVLQLDADHPARNMVATSNPMSADESAMRTTLLPSLLKAAARNHAHRADSIALFEIARVYEPSAEELPQEALVLAGVFCGVRRRKEWSEGERPWDFFGARGVVEAAVTSLGLPSPGFTEGSGMPFHPTRAASVDLGGAKLGVLGEIHPDVCAAASVPERTVVFELALAPLLAALPARVQAVDPPRFPPVLIDLAVVVDETTHAKDVETVIRAAGEPEVAHVRLFDVYRGEQVGAGKKSLAFALELRNPSKTMTDDEAMAVRDRILPALRERTGATVRE